MKYILKEFQPTSALKTRVKLSFMAIMTWSGCMIIVTSAMGLPVEWVAFSKSKNDWTGEWG
jgi:hypothetical protein